MSPIDVVILLGFVAWALATGLRARKAAGRVL